MGLVGLLLRVKGIKMTEKLYINETKEEFDAIVVGSGITGGWAAKEFCERGFKTLMIERGRVVEHRKDYTHENKPVWQLETRSKVPNLLTEQQHKVQAECYAFTDATKHFFGNDRDLPYSTEKGTKFTWIRGNQLGGKSLLWHRQSYRMSEFDFQNNKLDGEGNDWPIRYDDLTSWYTHVEKHVGISGEKAGLKQLPDSVFQPPFELTQAEKDVQAKLAKLYPDRPLVMGRTAHLTQPTSYQIQQGRVTCQARNECQKGCSFGAYFSTQSSTLPAAVATGNLHIAPNSVVESLIYDETTKQVKGVNVIDNETLTTREYRGKVVFLCASTLGSTQILMNTKTPSYPNGLANRSGVLGHYLMDHCYNAWSNGELEGYDDEFYSGRRPTGIYIPNFQYTPSKYKKGYKRGYALGGSAYRDNWKIGLGQKGFGAEFKDSLTKPGKWRFNFYAQGEMLPKFENQVSLHPSKKDKWGMPQLHFNVTWSDNERAMMEDAADTCREMLVAIGAKNINSWTSTDGGAPGLAIHEVGTARMGRDPKDSVLNGYNQAHDINNLFVTDGSAYCSTATVNPSLTFMAMTARAVDYCVTEMKNRRI
jgi:choline dehydrogenase-like flavoprotein